MGLRIVRTSAAAALVAALTAACGAGAPPPTVDGHEQVTLTVVSAFQRDDPLMDGYWLFEEHLAQDAPWIELDYRGASEVMPPAQLGESVATGAIDLAPTSATFHSQNVPLARSVVLSPLTPAQERERGAYDLLAQAHERAGLHYLGKISDKVPYRFYFQDEVDPLDLDGLSIRTSPVYSRFLARLGAGPVAMPAGELYGALERGVVDGYGWPALGVVDAGWAPVTAYETEATFYNMDLVVIVSQTSWEELDEDTRAALDAAMLATEAEIGAHYEQAIAAEQQEREAAGVQVLPMTPEQTDRFVSLAYEAGWEEATDRTEDARRLREIYGN